MKSEENKCQSTCYTATLESAPGIRLSGWEFPGELFIYESAEFALGLKRGGS